MQPFPINDIYQYALRLKIKTQNNKHAFDTLIILGGNGTGKTHLGISILQKINYNGLYISSPTLCRHLIHSRSFNALKEEDALLKEIASVRFLVIDEIGRARDAETEEHALYDIINLRYELMLETCLISNKSRNKLQDFLGNATMDRISEAYTFAELKAISYRKKNKI